MKSKILTLLLAGVMSISLASCGGAAKAPEASGSAQASEAAAVSDTEISSSDAESPEPAKESETDGTSSSAQASNPVGAEEKEAEKNGDIYILFTSDVHCGVNRGFGYAGLKRVKDTLEEKGYETILVDDGDSIQGEAIGTLSKGEAIVDLMNEIGYDVAIPGNHEFDYGTDRFLELVQKAHYTYISCNFTYLDEPVLEPYVIKEAAGKKIAFVGATTPRTMRGSTPAYFQNEEGEYVYGFMQDDTTGAKVYEAVQNAADTARAEGADYVYLIAHLGNEEACRPWTYADVIANTSGIDVVLDGHSHDTDQVVMKNKNGENVARSAVGTKLGCIGYSHISADGEIVETGIWSWPNKISAPELLDIRNDMTDMVSAAEKVVEEQMNIVVAASAVELSIYDPEEVDSNGRPIRMIRRAETNMGDFCADAYRDQSDADIAIENGGAIRAVIDKGDITYGDIIAVKPFGNAVCVIEVTGQQILDALEWGSRYVPDESGAFLQVSGLSYEINSALDNPCTEDENGMFTGIAGERRVQNVMIGEEPLDSEKTYTLAGQDFLLLSRGDGFTMFEDSPVLKDNIKLDNQALIDYIVDTLGGVIGEEYADLYGQGRITILE